MVEGFSTAIHRPQIIDGSRRGVLNVSDMGVSLDGFIAGPGGEIAVVPDEELHRFHNQQARELGVHLYGRRLYEVMSAWETYAGDNPSAPEHELEFARIWKATPKVVFSHTLEKVEGNATLAEGDIAETVAGLKAAGRRGSRPRRRRSGRGVHEA